MTGPRPLTGSHCTLNCISPRLKAFNCPVVNPANGLPRVVWACTLLGSILPDVNRSAAAATRARTMRPAALTAETVCFFIHRLLQWHNQISDIGPRDGDQINSR